jgi:hypothetical protein
MTHRTDPELRAFLASYHGKRTRLYLTNGQDTTGIVNTTTWDGDRPTSIYLVSTEDPDLAAVLIPWHAVAAVGKLLPERPSARGDEPPRHSGPVPVIPTVPAGEMTGEQADEVMAALRADNAGPS